MRRLAVEDMLGALHAYGVPFVMLGSAARRVSEHDALAWTDEAAMAVHVDELLEARRIPDVDSTIYYAQNDPGVDAEYTIPYRLTERFHQEYWARVGILRRYVYLCESYLEGAGGVRKTYPSEVATEIFELVKARIDRGTPSTDRIVLDLRWMTNTSATRGVPVTRFFATMRDPGPAPNDGDHVPVQIYGTRAQPMLLRAGG